ncbi:MAG: TonB-dependent receptor [Saprospirales bacterium]|nr:MAG: TonB-dependent receptor [Saprospirales bacterium]
MKGFLLSFRFHVLLLFALTVSGVQLKANGVISGKVLDELSGEPIELAIVQLRGTSLFSESGSNGDFRLDVPSDVELNLSVSRVGYHTFSQSLDAVQDGENRIVNIYLAPVDSDLEVIVRSGRIEEVIMIRERAEELRFIPSVSGNFESLLSGIALGTYGGTGGELSSQYNVRGGNYDENLVYVNDFEIYRPQLISTSQQEGLSFPNIHLIRDVSFSSGGFLPRYGDKMSSVLDIRYRVPEEFRLGIEASLLGGGVHLEGSGFMGDHGRNRLRYLGGFRYKTTSYLLGTLDVTGEYAPDFYDFQAFVTWDFSPELQLGVIGNYNRSIFSFIPEERSTAAGLIDFALQLSSVFEGSELDDFENYMGGVSLTYLPERVENPLYLRFLASGFQSNENESTDILGFYRLAQIETDIGSDNLGDEIALLGTGTQHTYKRNFLTLRVLNVKHKGGIEFNELGGADGDHSHFLEWGFGYKREFFDDWINEWERLDSAGYSLPYDGQTVNLFTVLKTTNREYSNRFEGFLQNSYTVSKPGLREWQIAGGLRFNYWDFNREFIVSPRASASLKPLNWDRDMSFRLSAGLYSQPPFYREVRRPDGTINQDLKAQQSFHFVGGMTWDFGQKTGNRRKFRWIAELYYKHLWNLVSYELDNVKISYSGENDARGYVIGLDTRLNGEFVPGAESWINLSILRARERLDGVTHLKRELGEPEAQEVKDVPRPSDQLVSVSIFFQDYLPRNENFKMHLNLELGTGLPFGLRGNNRVFRNTYRYSPYHRVDIGFSYLLWDEQRRDSRPNSFFRHTRRVWASLEVFNLMQVQNEASKTWIKTIFQTQYAIPNYLTSRRINLRIQVDI